MFRDSRGVVHTVSSADPLLDLPAGTASALSHALLRPDERDLPAALERCEAVRELIEGWQDAFFATLPDEVDLAEEARWAAEAGLSLDEVEAGYLDDDDEDEDDDDEELEDELMLDALDLRGLEGPADLEDELDELAPEPDEAAGPVPDELVPEELVSVLERELLLLPLRVRLEALVAAGDLVATWVDLLADHEKLLGHLVLAHDEPGEPDPHEDLAQRHAVLHGAQGPGHAVDILDDDEPE